MERQRLSGYEAERQRAYAWDEYLSSCRTTASNPIRYEEVEVWAWNRLQRRLVQIDKQREHAKVTA